jgi:hypothetical protein
MNPEREDGLSDFIKSVDEMIAGHFAVDALSKLRDSKACEVKDWAAAERILEQLIRSSIVHARSQVAGRTTGTMTFDQAMDAVRAGAKVTRPSWDILCLVAINVSIDDEERPIFFWKLDNCDGTFSGDGWPYKPTDEDRASTDWMLYQRPQDNWVELDF